MSDAPSYGPATQPGLIWGFDFADGPGRPLSEAEVLAPQPPGVFRWLHLSLSDLRVRRWLAISPLLPAVIRTLLLDDDEGQRYLIAEGVLALVLHDLEYKFDAADPTLTALRVALGPHLIVTARAHPVRCAERVKRRLGDGAAIGDPAAALELLLGALNEVQSTTVDELDDRVQAMEEDLLRERPPPDARTFLTLRSLMVRLHRAFSGARIVFNRLDDDPALPEPLRVRVVRFTQRTAAIDAELLATQSQLRLLRDELDLQATQRTNQNLYILSILSVLLLPATLITGLFGMNTGGLPWQSHHHGTLLATLAAVGASAAVYVGLRLFGFLRR